MAAERNFKIGQSALEARDEAVDACQAWPAFNSLHEGYAVILEELDELWAECKKKNPDKTALRHEAIQVAAMALRFVAELT